jgi:hypothetical protein
MNLTLRYKQLNSPTEKRTASTISFVVVFVLGLLFPNASQAQLVSTSYDFSQVDTGNTYTAITGGSVFASGTFTTATPLSVPIGFTFNFNGVNYTNATISDNGFITFGGTLPTGGNATPISGLELYAGAIAAFGVDLRGAVTNTLTYPQASFPTEIRYETITVSGQQVFVVQYKNVVRKAAGIGVEQLGLMNMQIRLYQGTNVIETVYNVFGNGSGAGTLNGQIGLRGAAGDFNNRKYSAGPYWTSTIAGTASGDAMILSNSIFNNSIERFIWTPCYLPTALSGLLQANNTTVDFTWTEPTIKPTSYDYELRTSGLPGSGPVGRFALGTLNSPVTALQLTGLINCNSYTLYVKSNCRATWTKYVSTVVGTPSPNATIPYLQNFESVTAPAIPICNSVQAFAVGIDPAALMVTVDNTSVSSFGFANKNITTVGSTAMDSWFFTQKINFATAGSYKLTYKYGGTRQLPQFVQKMRVAYGPNAIATAGGTMTGGTVIADHNNIKGSPLTNTINFQVSTPGVYYIGFHGYANATNGSLQLDDITVDVSTCGQVTSLIIPASQITSNSALVSWTVPSTGVPAGGYEYYLSTTSTAPLNTATPTGTTTSTTTLINLASLTSSTTYYVWVRGNCGGGDAGQWSPVGIFTTLFQPAYCVPGVPTSATTSNINNFTTTGGAANINNSTGFTTSGYADYTNLFAAQAANGVINFSVGITGPTVGIAIWVDWNNNGVFETSERMYNTGTYVSAASGSFTVPAAQLLGAYRMRVALDYWATSPDPCVFAATGGGRGEIEDYTFKVTPTPPALTISGSATAICSGFTTGTVSVTSLASNYDDYSWSPSTGVTQIGASLNYTFNPTTTTTYTLTATQTSGSYLSSNVKYIVTVNPLPTPIIVIPATSSICRITPSTIVPIVATGGIVSGVVVSGVSEDFNSGLGAYTRLNNSINGAPAVADWAQRPSPYTTPTAAQTISSNDVTPFMLSESDGQGSTGTTNTELISPAFDLSGYTDASLSFWHYYRSWINGSANVEISTDGGTNYTTLTSYTTTTQGAAAGFVNVTINLNSYVGVGFTNLKIRFRYTAQWGYRWCIDNVKVTGSTSTSVTWSPTTNLYTNPAATTAYVAGNPASTVYVKGITAGVFNYTALAVSPQGCQTTSVATVTVTDINAGTASSNQSICTGKPANLVLTGYVGTVTRWQYANTLAAISTTPINIPSSASATLTSAQMGTLYSDRYYRAVVTNGSCTAFSNVVKITYSNTIWDGYDWSNGLPNSTTAVIFEGDYISSGDVNACSVAINGGDITFLSGHSLIVQNEVDTSGGTLTFENNASLVQVVDVANTPGNYNANNSGDIIYNRNTTPVNRFDYTYWSTPVWPQTLVGLSPLTLADKYFYYNAAANNWVGINSSSLMNPGKGYIIRAPQTSHTSIRAVVVANAVNGQFSGTPISGTFTTPIVGANSLNLIGNPYPSALNADLFLGLASNQAVVGGSIYFWTHNTPITANSYNGSDYAIYNLAGSIGTAATNPGVSNSAPLGKIAAGQGFFIQGIANGVVTFKNAMRVSGDNLQFYKDNTTNSAASSLEKHRVWLEVSNAQGAYKQAMVGYIETATNGLDRDFDGEVFDVGNTVMLYSTLGTKKLGIQGKALPFAVSDIIPLGFKSTVASSYEIKLSDFDGLFVNQAVYLEDKLMQVIHDLKQSNYSFVTAVGTFEDRFQLRFTTTTLDTADNVLSNDAVIVFKNGQNIQINTSNFEIQSVVVFDIRGAQLYAKQNVNANALSISNLNSSQQVLLVKITGVDGKTVTKKVLF